MPSLWQYSNQQSFIIKKKKKGDVMLLLREMCQPILDKYGLNLLHVEPKEFVLALVGECGKPITLVNGVRIGRRISKVDRELVVKYLEIFLVKNIDRIQPVIAELIAFNSVQKPEIPEGFYEYSQTLAFSVGEYNRIFFSSSGVAGVRGNVPFDVMVDILQRYSGIIPVYFTEYNAYKERQANLKKALDALSTCAM